MNPTAPLVKIDVIEGSVRCFVLGLLGLVPVLGIPMIIMASDQHRRVKRIRAEWNPAERYLHWGEVCARLGVVLLLFEAVTVMTIITMSHNWP